MPAAGGRGPGSAPAMRAAPWRKRGRPGRTALFRWNVKFSRMAAPLSAGCSYGSGRYRLERQVFPHGRPASHAARLPAAQGRIRRRDGVQDRGRGEEEQPCGCSIDGGGDAPLVRATGRKVQADPQRQEDARHGRSDKGACPAGGRDRRRRELCRRARSRYAGRRLRRPKAAASPPHPHGRRHGHQHEGEPQLDAEGVWEVARGLKAPHAADMGLRQIRRNLAGAHPRWG